MSHGVRPPLTAITNLPRSATAALASAATSAAAALATKSASAHTSTFMKSSQHLNDEVCSGATSSSSMDGLLQLPAGCIRSAANGPHVVGSFSEVGVPP